jgi:membrane protease YdiL (CAAX protease family)
MPQRNPSYGSAPAPPPPPRGPPKSPNAPGPDGRQERGESRHPPLATPRLTIPRPGQPATLTAGAPPSPAGGKGPPPAWKVLLALLCLSLTGLLWVQGMAASLSRPSVSPDLEVHQLELTALVADTVPPALAPALVGTDPRDRLARELSRQMLASPIPAPAVRRLELALLERQKGQPGASESLRELVTSVDGPRRPLLEALLRGQPQAPPELALLLEPWQAPVLVQQLVCEQLGGPGAACPAQRQAPWWLARLLAVSVLPVLLLVGGSLLVLRDLWRSWRGRLAPAPPLLGPPLNLVDITLLIAGGFVLVGEVLLPQLLQAPLQAALLAWTPSAALGQGLQVLLLYLSLTAVPLLLLALMLRPAGAVPAGGWLRWGWRPWAGGAGQAALTLLKVLPGVALAGWLVESFAHDPGGSNPMLDLVLHRPEPLALACFLLTAVVVAPLFEETLFRGVLLPGLAPRLGNRGAVLLSAALFAAAHLSLAEWLPLFVLGCGLGLLRLRSGRLGPPVLMHGLWNGLTFVNLLLLGG